MGVENSNSIRNAENSESSEYLKDCSPVLGFDQNVPSPKDEISPKSEINSEIKSEFKSEINAFIAPMNKEDDDDSDNEDENENENENENELYDDQSTEIPQIFSVENIKNPQTSADFRYLHYPTTRLKSIKRALSLCGHSIVGDGGAVKSAKGIFASVVSVTIYDPNYNEYDQINNELNSEYNLKSDQNSTDLNQINSEKSNENSNEKVTDNKLNRINRVNKINKKIMPFTISIPDPLKFEKLMKKEEELWIRAEKKICY